MRTDGADNELGMLQDELILLFRRARVFFRSAANAAHPELQSAGYALLAYVVDEGPLRASALVEHFGTDKGVISRQLAQLQSLDLVQRLPDPGDGRAQLVESTPAGRERCQLARAAGRQRMRDQLKDWDESELQQLVALVAKFNRTLVDRDPTP